MLHAWVLASGGSHVPDAILQLCAIKLLLQALSTVVYLVRLVLAEEQCPPDGARMTAFQC